MPRLLILTPGEFTRDPRARRAAAAARAASWEVHALGAADAPPSVPVDGVSVTRVGGQHVSGALRSIGLGGGRRDAAPLRELRGLFRLVRLARLTLALAAAAGRLGRFDVIHVNDVDALPAGAWLARRGTARLVYDAHELYAEQEVDPPRLQRAVLARLERLLARRAAAVVTVSAPIADELAARLGLRRAPLVVLNCPPLEPAALGERHAGVRAIYQGAVGLGRQLDDLLDGAAALERVELALRIPNADRRSLERVVRRRGLSGRVVLLEPVEANEVVAALAGFDIGVVITRPLTRNDELALPNKLFEYLMAGLAVVAPELPGVAAVVVGDRVGATFEPGNPNDLARVLEELAAVPDELAAARARARAVAVDRYNAEAQRPALLAAWGA